MRKIGIVTSDIERDWASQQLLAAANEVSEGVLVDPLDFEVRTDGDASVWIRERPAAELDSFIIRGFNRQGEIDYQFEIFEILEQQGKLVINSPASLSIAESKSQTTYCLQNAGLPVPRTMVTQDMQEALEMLEMLGTAVLKPLYGSHGVGIEKLDTGAVSRELLQSFFQQHGIAYIQEFVPNPGRDIRAFVVGDEVPAAMYRVARRGHWKTNVYQGSYCEPCELSAEMRDLCVEAARVIGLEYTGVDVVEGPNGPRILELNGAPSWWGLSEVTDRSMAMDIVSHAVRMLEIGQSARQPIPLRSS